MCLSIVYSHVLHKYLEQTLRNCSICFVQPACTFCHHLLPIVLSYLKSHDLLFSGEQSTLRGNRRGRGMGRRRGRGNFNRGGGLRRLSREREDQGRGGDKGGNGRREQEGREGVSEETMNKAYLIRSVVESAIGTICKL